jgi:hypothetical protein
MRHSYFALSNGSQKLSIEQSKLQVTANFDQHTRASSSRRSRRNDAFTRRNDELLQRKQRRIEDKLLIDREVQQQSDEAKGRFAARRTR